MKREHIPYTYLIGWPSLDRWYYGVRYAKGCNPSDLWNPYKTSSNHIKLFVEENGEPSVIQVRKIFSESASAVRWERRVLHKLKAAQSDRWLNGHNGGEKWCRPSNYTKNSVESNQQRSNTLKQRYMTIEHHTKGQVPWNKDLTKATSPLLADIGNKVSQSTTGKKRSQEFRNQRRDYMNSDRNHFRGKKQYKLTCPHCGQAGGYSGMKRHHFENCKSYFS